MSKTNNNHYFPKVKFSEDEHHIELETNIRLLHKNGNWYTQTCIQGGLKKYQEVDVMVNRLLFDAYASFLVNKDGNFDITLEANDYKLFKLYELASIFRKNFVHQLKFLSMTHFQENLLLILL